MIATVGIGSTKERGKDLEIPIARIYVTKDEEYFFLDSSVITRAITESLKRLERGEE